MLQKSQIFSFILSLITTFVVGFFIWNIFITPDNGVMSQILSEASKIGLNFSVASVSNSGIENIVQATDPEQDASSESPVENVDIESQNSVVAPAESFQDQLDDIQEKLDIISQQVQELIADQNHPVIRPDAPSDDGAKLDDKDQTDILQEENTAETAVCTGQININTASPENLEKIIYIGPVTAQKIIEARPFYSLNDLLRVSGIGEITLQKIKDQGCAYVEAGLVPPVLGGGSSPAPIVYPKILISEVQISPIAQRFVELYNPNNTDVDLTGWYLQRKTSDSWNSFVSSTKFAGKIILANSYFLISRSDVTAGITLSDLTLTPNNFLDFKNPDEKIADQMGFGTIDDNKSIGRKPSEEDTDNDSADFELDTPTPRAQNIAYVAPLPPADTTAPVITLIGNSEITITVGNTYTDAGATASDDVDGDITAKIAVINPVVNTVGNYIMTYNVSDSAGNNAIEVTRLVHIVAATIPPTTDPTAPEVLSFYPSDNSVDVPVDVQPTLTFSEALDPSTVTPKSSNIELRIYGSATKVPATLSLSAGNTVVTVTLSSSLLNSQQYYFFIGSDVQDVSGNKFAKDTWYKAEEDSHEFTTAAVLAE